MGFRSLWKKRASKERWLTSNNSSKTLEKKSFHKDFTLMGFTRESIMHSLTEKDFRKKHRISNIFSQFTSEKMGEKKESLKSRIDNFFHIPTKEPSIVEEPSNFSESAPHALKGLITFASTLKHKKDLFKQCNFLRYRENVFRAASRLTTDMPPYPDWVYENEKLEYLDIYKINVGGVIFFLFDDTLKNLIDTKLATCVRNHKNPGIPFFDRDHKCFKQVINFYRTGHLHVPPNTCPSLFEEELEFWGVSELFIEPCCWSGYSTFKRANITLKKFAEDINKGDTFDDKPTSTLMKWRMNVYKSMSTGSGSVFARWVSTFCTLFIVLSVLIMILGSSTIGRVDIETNEPIEMKENETVTNYYSHTKQSKHLAIMELMISIFFLLEVLIRLILCPKKLVFFSDTFNSIDLFATSTSLLTSFIIEPENLGLFEVYVLILKIPRILRLFKVTSKMRSGMEAFILTIKACTKELKLVFLMLFTATSFFGSLIFVVEMINENENNLSKIKTANEGLWLAFVSMSTVGYGDYYPITYMGYFVTSICILCGVIICQFPVPIFLQNFRVYHTQANARLNHKSNIVVSCVDPEIVANQDANTGRTSLKRKGKKIFKNLFKTL